MWVIVLVTVGLATGPNVGVVTESGLFADRATCERELAEKVPAVLEPDLRAAWERGERVYACVRLSGAGDVELVR